MILSKFATKSHERVNIMKKILLYVMISLFCPLGIMAQSSMTDDQVIKFVIKEHEAGKSQSHIVTKLMQNGVDIQQIRRVKAKYDRQIKQGGLGVVADEAMSKTESRMRKNNGDTKEGTVKDKSSLRLEGGADMQHT